MSKILTILLGISILLISLNAQENLPTYSAVQYSIQTDSLAKSNQPQDLQIMISSNPQSSVDVYELKIHDLKVLWTIVSAKLNGQPIWLVNMDSKPDQENVLSWKYYSDENLLRIYPSNWNEGYDLELLVQVSILQPGMIAKSDSKNLSLEAMLGDVKYKCPSLASRGDIIFKRNAQSVRK